MESMTAWPALTLDEWKDTYATVHLWTQLLGKTRLALSPPENHYWHTALYVTPRGLNTSAMPYRERTIDVELDFVDHQIVVRSSDGRVASMSLTSRPVKDVYRDYVDLLRSCDVDVRMWPVPVEIADPIPFPDDDAHASYDPEPVRRCWQVLAQATRALEQFRTRFVGKCSPAHFWWGAFDIACTRFSGRPAPAHPGGVPHLADHVTRESYSHECISAGWWPGTIGGAVQEPAFYAYAYPEPDGCATAPIRPEGAYYHTDLHEWVFPYAAMRSAPDPDSALRDFLESTYEAAATLAGWDRAALERRTEFSC